MIRKAIAFALSLFVLHCLWQLSNGFGLNRYGYIHRPGKCKNVLPVETRSEDIALPSDGLAFISSGLKLRSCTRLADPRGLEYTGRIYVFDMNHPEEDAMEASLPKEVGENFNPHGVSLWEDPDTGELRLFVVNHKENIGEVVEILRYDRDTSSFSYVRSVRSSHFVRLNDIAAVGPESFYAVNDGYFDGCSRILEVYLGLPLSGLVFYDGNLGRATWVLRRMWNCNSAAVSKDGNFLFLTQLLEHTVNIYNRSKNDGSLELIRAIHVGVAVDNVFEDQTTGALWFGAHPAFHLFMAHVGNLDVKAPSAVIRLRPSGIEIDPFSSYELHSPFGDDGTLISGSSSAVRYRDKVLIGSVIHKLVICELQN